MDQDVPKGDDSAVLAHTCDEALVKPGKMRQSFADNFELTLDCRAEHGVALLIFKSFAEGELRDSDAAC